MNGPRGQHICLDYLGWQCPDDEGGDGAAWMLEVLREGARLAGAREVHAHVQAFDGSESPEGFAAVVLIDESHVSAHCYADSGQLAIDAFTCGGGDAEVIADHIHAALTEAIPEIRLLRRQALDRFLYGDD
mgnify:FL=1